MVLFFMKPELLAPCNNIATLKAAINSGADAVYFGVQKYNMRMKAGNFSIDELTKIVELCHDSGVKAYLTTNIVLYENELNDLRELLKKAKIAGVDAVIVHDLAVLKMARELGLEVHISTQANVSNSVAANVYADLGVSRVILARELSLEQIEEVSKNSRIPVEVFVHGAMCVSISGRCFFSQAMYCKSANRGECYQPCRQPWVVKNEEGEFIYDGERFMNAKDLCMIEHLPKIKGASCFKIEGRMKDANYVSTVVSVYREAIDDWDEHKVPAWLEKLKSVFNRGFSTGFYFIKPDKEVNMDSYGNHANQMKVEVGKVTNYYQEHGVVEIKLTSSDLKVGDTLVIETRDEFFKQTVSSIEVDNKPVACAVKGQWVGVKFDQPVRKGLMVYKLETITKN